MIVAPPRAAISVNTPTPAGPSSLPPGSLRRLSKIVFALAAVWIVAVVAWANYLLASYHADSPQLPFGVHTDASHSFYVQDFSYHMIFLKGLREHIVAEPYRLEQQETLMRHMIPGLPAGMSHGYSPVLLVLMWPLLGLSGHQMYVTYTILGGVATLLLVGFYLLPRVTSGLQFCAIATCVMGVCLAAAYVTGQSTLVTTPLLALFWALLQNPPSHRSLSHDIALAVIFWVLCVKPNVAMIPFFLLLGGREWRALAVALLLLLATWTATANFYGGWWTGLRDYAQLLSYYHPADFPPFFRRDLESPLVFSLFPLNNALFIGVNVALVGARWAGRVTPSEHFQATIWALLLLSPYLLASEHWALVLLVVEGTFFATSTPITAVMKLLLIFGVLYFRYKLNSPVELSIPCKWILFLWILSFTIEQRMKRGEVPANAEASRAA